MSMTTDGHPYPAAPQQEGGLTALAQVETALFRRLGVGNRVLDATP